MVKLENGQFEAKVILTLKVYLENDEKKEISQEEAKILVQKKLERLSMSNDGSELLANVTKEDIFVVNNNSNSFECECGGNCKCN